MQNATVREYTRRFNTVENCYRSVKPSYLRPRDRGNYKESTACPITKASNCSHFHIPLFFLFSTSPAMQYERFFSPSDTFSFLPRDRGNYKESVACPITKASNSSHFHFPLMFLFFTFPAMQYQRFFSLFDTFSRLRNLTYAFSVELLYHKDRNMFCLLNKVKPCCAEIVLGWVTKYEYPVM